MRMTALRLLAFLLASAALSAPAQQLMNVPVRINMGGTETVDSFGRTWLGDGPGGGDPLNIRPNDAGGANFAENWSLAAFQPDSLDLLGFDSTDPGDSYIFNTIRWDDGAGLPDFLMEIPIPEGSYTVNMYFNEGCCPLRHFKIEIQGTIVDDDVSYLDYDPATPALGRVGVLSFPDSIVGPDNVLRIGLLPCTVIDCPDGGDINAIIDALEVVSAPQCDHNGLDFNCLYRTATNDVVATWNTIGGADGFRILKNGAQLGADLPGSANSITDSNPSSGGVYVTYQLQALDGATVFSSCRCSLTAAACPGNLSCAVNQGSGEVGLSWETGGGVTLTGFEVRRNGTLITTLPGTASTYEDTPADGRNFVYSVTPISDPAGFCAALTCSVIVESNLFDIPLRINMGGAETVDSRGRVWLGDGPGSGDPLSIRPDDASGTNWIENWCTPNPTSLRALGFDPANPGDNYIMSTIRWDNGPLLNGGDASDFVIELPIPNRNDYLVNLYFNECCCPNRHFKIELNGELVNPDVSEDDYGTPPANGKLGRLTFRDVLVDTELLRIGLLPCDPVDCPGTGDNNAIINAIEVTSIVCPDARTCPQNLSCTITLLNKKVAGFWDAPICLAPTGYEVYRNGDLILTLPGDVNTFTDTLPGRVGSYEVKPLLAAGESPCPTMGCTVQNPRIPFEIPLRLNMGGRFLTDSRGNKWIGDLGGSGDALDLRPDDASGTNTIESWCSAASVTQGDSMRSLGLNPANSNDQGIFNTIRWDVGADVSDFRLEIPVPNGDYLLNLYFTECCCFNRHFMLEVEGEILDEDIHAGDYSTVPALGRTGRLSFDGVSVTDEVLNIAFLPCPLCDPTPFPTVDTNAIIDAIELLASGTVNKTCPRDLLCTLEGGDVNGSWIGPDNVTLTGYDVYRNGSKIETLPPSATSFSDLGVPCERILQYEVAVLGEGADFLCPGMRMRCVLTQPDCPWAAPIRINMGGAETVDSKGNLWLGDGPGAGDPLEIRPDDLGGSNWIENWTLGLQDPASFTALGFDSTHPGDQYIFNTIRWDNGGDASNFELELPIANGEYLINLYFNEAGGSNRHFQVELEGTIVDDDVSYLDYDPAAPAFGKLGRLSFEKVAVTDGALNIGLLPCPTCPGVNDINAIIDAVEVLGGSVVVTPQFHRGDADQNGVLQLTDAVQVLGYLFLGIPTKVPDCLDAADTDDNGVIQLTDAVRILGYLFLGLGPPAPPGPPTEPCGPDPTADDALDPCVYTGCL